MICIRHKAFSVRINLLHSIVSLFRFEPSLFLSLSSLGMCVFVSIMAFKGAFFYLSLSREDERGWERFIHGMASMERRLVKYRRDR